VQLVHHGGLADARISRHQHEFQRAVRHDSVEGSEQSLNLALPQPVRYVATAEREGLDPATRLPLRQAAPKIGLDTGGSLVPLLAGLGEKLHDERFILPVCSGAM
jgi:hypothetical protein